MRQYYLDNGFIKSIWRRASDVVRRVTVARLEQLQNRMPDAFPNGLLVRDGRKRSLVTRLLACHT